MSPTRNHLIKWSVISEQVNYPTASFEEGVLFIFISRRKNGFSQYEHPCALNSEKQKVRN